jgi:hypothetical protein
VTQLSPPAPDKVRASIRPAGRTAIPWTTVLTFAAVLATADWFWVVALRGAVGATERTSGPFLSWVEGSVLLIPLFAFAVLGALALAHRWFGAAPRRRRAVLATALLVVVAGTLAGIGALIASGSYDLRLQLNQHMGPMGVNCHPVSCHQLQQDATVALQLKALGIGSLFLLVTNLVLVFWVLALRGGRIHPGKVLRSGPAGAGARQPAWSGEVLLLLVAGLVGTATVLAVHATADLLHSVVAAMALLMVATALLVVAQQAMSRPGRSAWIGAAAIATALPAVWVWAHLTGHQLGGVLKSIGLADGAVGVLDLVTLAAAVLLLSSPAWLRRAPASPHAGKLGVVAVIAIAAIGVGGSGLAIFDLGGLDETPAPGHHHVAVG